jgi:hypothetical protein
MMNLRLMLRNVELIAGESTSITAGDPRDPRRVIEGPINQSLGGLVCLITIRH